MKIRTKLALYKLGVYTLGFVIMFAVSTTYREDMLFPKLKRDLRANNSVLKKTGLSVWGPVTGVKAGDVMDITFDVAGLRKSEVWGEVSLVEQKLLEDSGGQLLRDEELIKLIDGKSVGDKQKILELYSFPFEFWQAEGIDDGYHWSESTTSKNLTVEAEDSRSFYLLLEHQVPLKASMLYNEIDAVKGKMTIIKADLAKKIRQINRVKPEAVKGNPASKRLLTRYIKEKTDYEQRLKTEEMIVKTLEKSSLNKSAFNLKSFFFTIKVDYMSGWISFVIFVFFVMMVIYLIKFLIAVISKKDIVLK